MSHQNVSMLNGRFSELFSYFNNLWHLNTYVDYTLSRLTDHLKLGDVNENTTNCIMLLDVQLYWTKWKQDQLTLRPYLQHYTYLLHQLISFTVKDSDFGTLTTMVGLHTQFWLFLISDKIVKLHRNAVRIK